MKKSKEVSTSQQAARHTTFLFGIAFPFRFVCAFFNSPNSTTHTRLLWAFAVLASLSFDGFLVLSVCLVCLVCLVWFVFVCLFLCSLLLLLEHSR